MTAVVTRDDHDAVARRRPRPVTILAVLAVALVAGALVWNSWQAVRQGWVAEGDAAIIAVRTHDVFSAHPPLLGNPSTASDAAKQNAYHPGPIEFALLAVPLRVFGPGTNGLVWGTCAIEIAAVAVLAWFARRRRGPTFVIWTMAMTLVLVWGLGNEIPHDPYNPHVVLLPMFVLLVLAWSLACGDLVALPVAVAVASLIAQSHVYDGLFVALVALAIVVALVVHFRRGAREERTRILRWAGASAVLGFVLWLPPIVYELTHRPGNFSALLSSARSPDSRGEGVTFAAHRLVDALAPPWRWLDGQPTFVELHSSPGGGRTVVAVVILAAMVAAGVLAWRARRRVTSLLLGTAVFALAVSFAVAARLPRGLASLSPYNHRHWWITGVFAFVALGWGAYDLARTRRRVRAASPVVAACGVAVVAVLAVAVGAHVTIKDDRGSASFGAIRALTPPVVAAVDGRQVLVTSIGAQAFTSIEPGLVAMLIDHGVDARVLASEGNVFGAHHVGDASIPTHLYIVSGAGVDQAPATGARLIGRYDARADAQRGFANAGVGAAEPIAVYLVTA